MAIVLCKICQMPVQRLPPYTPPRQTADQKDIMDGIIRRAIKASEKATPAVLSILNNTPGSLCHQMLRNTSFRNASATKLLDLLYASVMTAELAHSFRLYRTVDASLCTDMNLSFYPNLYQTRYARTSICREFRTKMAIHLLKGPNELLIDFYF